MATKKKETTTAIQPLHYNLTQVDLLGMTIQSPAKDFKPEQPFGFRFKLHFRYLKDKVTVIIAPTIEITNEDQSAVFAEFKTQCVFELHGSTERVFKKEEKGTSLADEKFAHLLNGIALSTSRGIIYMAVRGTHLHNAIMPIIDPQLLTLQGKE